MNEFEVVARCEKCGRGFISMPADGKDHYFPPHKRDGAKCLGTVKPLAAAQSDA